MAAVVNYVVDTYTDIMENKSGKLFIIFSISVLDPAMKLFESFSIVITVRVLALAAKLKF